MVNTLIRNIVGMSLGDIKGLKSELYELKSWFLLNTKSFLRLIELGIESNQTYEIISSKGISKNLIQKQRSQKVRSMKTKNVACESKLIIKNELKELQQKMIETYD